MLGACIPRREARDAVAIARRAFDRYSFDLIYARPDQTPAMWPTNLSLRSRKPPSICRSTNLTIEEDTPFFGLHAAGKLKTPDEATARALYDVTQESVPCMAYRAYEISNHARRARVPAYLVYWRGGEYAAAAPARMAGSISTACDGDRRPTGGPKPG